MKNNILKSLIVSGALLGGAQAQNITPPTQEIKNSPHSVPVVLATTQSNVNSVYSSTGSGTPTQHIAYFNEQINKGSWSIDAKLNMEMEKQRGDWARNSGGLVSFRSDGSLGLGFIPKDLDTSIAADGGIKIKYTFRFR